MSDATTRDYYVSRVAAERYKAENALDPTVAAVHCELADQYAARIVAIDNPSDDPVLAIIPRADSSIDQSQA
ncbi:MAG: hypothetical protein ABI898_03095 [Sphingomonadales bacterium]